MSNPERKPTSEDLAYEYRSARMTFGVGAMLGFVLSSLVYFALSKWLPESWYAPIVLTSALSAGCAASFFWPVERLDRNPDHYPGALTPAERVDRLHDGPTTEEKDA